MKYSKIINYFLNNFKKVDIFGVNLQFSYAKMQYHKTYCGSLLTMILFSLFLFKFIISLKEIILKENLDFKINEIPIRDDFIELKNLQLAVCPLYAYNTKDTTFNKYYQINSILYDQKSDKVKQNITLESKTCIDQVINKNFEIFAASCFCLRFNETDYMQIGKNSSLFSSSFMRLDLKMNMTFTGKEEIEKFKIFNKQIKKMVLLYSKIYVNVTDYYNPIRTHYEFTETSFNDNSHNDILFETNKLQVDIINDIFTFGLVQPDNLSMFSYEILKKSFSVESNIYQNSFSTISISFKHSGLLKLFSIYSFSIDTFVSKFGGLLQVFHLLFTLVSTIFNDRSLKKYINKRFEKSIKNIPKLIDNIDLYIQNSNSELSFTIPKENKTQILNRENEDVKSVISSNSNKFIIENKNSLFNKNNKCSIRIEMEKIDLTATTKTKMKNSNKKKMLNLNYRDNLIDDFNSILDYEKYYEIIKELKLIKYFLLDGENVKWINKFQNIPFNIEKFEEFIIEESEGINSQMKFNFENIDSFYSKLNRLKDFMQKENN